eukprot:563790-Ditylum_brightwellii.AAC.1
MMDYSIISKDLSQINLSCSSLIKKEYYNLKDDKKRGFVTDLICSMCCNKESCTTKLYSEHKLQKNNDAETMGYAFLPLCNGCVLEKAAPVRVGRKDQKKAVAEKKAKRRNKQTVQDGRGLAKKSRNSE